ncbi:MAG: HNH endonuclease [Actinobacteria bacterium]|nr:HNH endonuclease [Actinomycetota bacterium]
MDIIKNKMLAAMDKKHAVDIGESFDKWQGLIAAIPDAGDQERFLRHFYNAFKDRPEIKVEKVTRATRSVIIRVYETLINRDASALFERLMIGATTYGKLLRSESAETLVADGLTELSRIGSAPAYVVLLYLFSLEEKHLDDPKFLEKIVNLLKRYLIRRNVTDKPPTRQIDQAFIALVESCAARIDAGETLGYNWFEDELMRHGRPASLDEFRAALSGDIYDSNSFMARYVLVQIDQMHHSREYRPDFWVRDEKGRFVWTVEHVLPQAEKLPEHWVTMLAAGDKWKAADLQDSWVHRLGNLTLSGYNSDLATASFGKKQKLAKDRSFLGHRINIGYQNGLALNSLRFKTSAGEFSLADAPRWDEELIEARTRRLVDMVISVNLPTHRTRHAGPRDRSLYWHGPARHSRLPVPRGLVAAGR